MAEKAKALKAAMEKVRLRTLPKPKLPKLRGGLEGGPYYMRPSLCLDDKELPDVKNLKIGQTVRLMAEGKVIGLRSDEHGTRADIELTKIGVAK